MIESENAAGLGEHGMRRAFIAVALIAGFWSASSHAQEKKTVTVNGVEKNTGSCEKFHTYVLQIFPDKILATPVGAIALSGTETIALSPDGTFAKDYRAQLGTGGVRMRIEGSLSARQIRVTMSGNRAACVWEGTI
jgi:hypothetical protein